MYLDARLEQELFQLGDSVRVELAGGDHERKGARTLAVLDRAPPHVVEVLDDPFAVSGDGIEQPMYRAQVVVDDVTKRPSPARPRIRVVDLRCGGRNALLAVELGGWDVDRRSDLDAGHLR